MSKEEQQKKIEQVIRQFKDIFVFKFGVPKDKLILNINTDAINLDKLDILSLFMEMDHQFSIHVSRPDVYGCLHMPVRNILNVLTKNLIETSQLTRDEAEMVVNQFDKVLPSSKKPQIQKTEPVKMISVPSALIDEYIATAEKMQVLAAKLKQYQK